MIAFQKRFDLKGHYVLLLSVILLIWGGRDFVLGFMSKSWPATEGRLLTSRAERYLEDSVPQVAYEYTVAGERYLGHRFSFKDATILYPMDFEMAYPEGGTTRVFYWPDHPSISTLQRGYSAKYLIAAVAGLVLFLLSLGIYLYEWRAEKSVDIG
ncbi:MAG: DUF3592 domain-containing protein [Desulfococcaceae bacterium]